MADLTYEEKLDGITSFCDMHETCIEDAKPGTTLWAIGMLDDAWLDIMTIEDEYLVTRGDETTQKARENIIDVMYYLCEKYAEESVRRIKLMSKNDEKITPMMDDRKLPDGVIPITEEDHPEEEWFKSAYDQTVETLPEFINHLMNDYCHDYGTVCHAIAACAMAAIHAANNTELNGGITGFQASFVMWDIVKQMCFRGNETGLRIIDYDNMLYPQYEYKFDKTIRSDTFKRLQEVAQKNLDEKSGCAEVRQHWQSIVDGKVPFGYTIKED